MPGMQPDPAQPSVSSGPSLSFTRDGVPIGSPIPVPPGANEVHLKNIPSDLGRAFRLDGERPGAGERPTPTAAEIVGVATRRGTAILDLVGRSVKLIERGASFEFQLEVLSSEWLTLSPFEIQMVSETYARLNLAIREGAIAVTPGVDSLRLVNLEAGLNALAPGMFDPRAVTAALNASPVLLAGVRGQWFPPGIRIDLTKEQTTQLIAILAAGGSLISFLVALGVSGPVAPVLAAALFLGAAAIGVAQSLSKNGTVGLKVTVLPIFPPTVIVVPFPT